ncbi:MAG: ribonuclease E inhibitor RraB [Bacteroidota bacterium]
MGLFDIFKSKQNKQYLSEDMFISNTAVQMDATPNTITQLRKIGASEAHNLKVEFFFYTNTKEKANQLANQLLKKEYSVEYYLTEDDSATYIITGWTTQMRMNEKALLAWTKEMCEIGYKYDCEFDGWGTTPDQ